MQLIFEEGVEGYWARQRVLERLAGSDSCPTGPTPSSARWPRPTAKSIATSCGPNGNHDLMELRTLNDWVVIPNLLRTPGVADVANFGGLAKQFTVTLEPGQLEHFGLTLDDVVDAVKANNANAGGSVLSRGSMSFVIRGRGALQDRGRHREHLHQDGRRHARSTCATWPRSGSTRMLPSGIFSKDDRAESVEGIVLMRSGENPSEVLDARQRGGRRAERRTSCPTGVQIEPFYDREMLVDSTLHTVDPQRLAGITAGRAGAAAVSGRPAHGDLVALTIPFSLLFALVLMYCIGHPDRPAVDRGHRLRHHRRWRGHHGRHIAERLHHAQQHQQPGQKLHVRAIVQAAALEVERPVFFCHRDDHRRLSAAADADAASKGCCSGRWR